MLGSLCRLEVATFGYRCGTVPTRHGLSTAELCKECLRLSISNLSLLGHARTRVPVYVFAGTNQPWHN